MRQAGTNRPVQYGRESAHKSRAQEAPPSLGVYMYAIQHISKEENETISGAWVKSAVADSAEPNSKAILQRICLLFLLRQHFCRRQYFSMRQGFAIRQRFWMRQCFSIRRRFRRGQCFCIRQGFWMHQCFCIYFAAPIFLCIFLHSYLVCANNLIGANVLRFLG